MREVSEHQYYPSPKPNRILRIKEVMERLGISRSHVYALCASGVLPQRISIVPGGSAVGWLESEIEDFLKQRIQDRG